MSAELICDVCGKKRHGIRAYSAICRRIYYYCFECLRSRREPYADVVSALAGQGFTTWNSIPMHYIANILATLDEEGISKEQFIQDLRTR